jgi:hypothetical protein
MVAGRWSLVTGHWSSPSTIVADLHRRIGGSALAGERDRADSTLGAVLRPVRSTH